MTDTNPSQIPFFVKEQWPDDITRGFIKYTPREDHWGLRFSISDASHGIPSIGCVGASGIEAFNYPKQTEEIARRLVACWSACVGIPVEFLEARAEILKERNRPNRWTDKQWEAFDSGDPNPSPQLTKPRPYTAGLLRSGYACATL